MFLRSQVLNNFLNYTPAWNTFLLICQFTDLAQDLLSPLVHAAFFVDFCQVAQANQVRLGEATAQLAVHLLQAGTQVDRDALLILI